MDDVLRGLDFCLAYLDDILIFSRPLEEHEQHLRALFDRLQNYGILITPGKGYKVSAEGSHQVEHFAKS
jgi:hypothetical protein